MQDYRQLRVWEKGHHVVLDVYQATAAFPGHELYGLTSQIRRASASVPTNIAEGCGRSGNTELRRFLEIALGSASELDYHLLLAHDLEFLPASDYERLREDVVQLKKMLATFIQRLKTENREPRTDD